MRQTLLSAVLICAASAPAWADDVAVIVGFHGDADPRVFAKHGGAAALDLGGVRATSGHIPASKVKALRSEPGVAYVEEDVVRHATYIPNDTYFASYQADDLALTKVTLAWDSSTGVGARVAVLDTGCQTGHPDLIGKVKAQKNFTGSRTSDVSDKHGHGTHTAGTVGAWVNNDKGVAGIGHSCELAIGKVLSNSGSGYTSWIIAGIDWARTTSKARVISLSLGSSSSTVTEEAAVNAAVAAGVLVVAAAGNEGDMGNALNYPGAYASALSVAAVDAAGTMAPFSNYGESVDIAAPGVTVVSTTKGSGYALMSGTSMATPHVAGVAALVISKFPKILVADLRTRLLGSAIDATGDNAGALKVINAAAAVSGP